MRAAPADLVLDPMPEDFTANIVQTPGLLKAVTVIDGRRYEIGLRGTGTADEVSFLKASVWQLHAIARTGRTELIAYASVDRHSHRPR